MYLNVSLIEQDNDYNFTYFDNGEGDMDDADDDDGPIYWIITNY